MAEVAEPTTPGKHYQLPIGPYPTDPEDRHLWREEAADA